MKAKTCLALAIAAGCASVATANPEKGVMTNQRPMTMDKVGYIYYNQATGEMTKIPPATTRGTEDSNPVWINELYDQCACGEWFFSSIRDSATGEDSWWMDWGDIQENSVIDAMTFLIATSVADPEEDGEEGFEMDISFFEATDDATIHSGMVPYLVYTITDIPGSSTGSVAGWLLTIDVSGGGEFEIGDADGVDDSGTGNNSGYGADPDNGPIDVDEIPGADFGYGFNFRHPETATTGLTGCGLVVPPEGVFPNELGDEDGQAIFFGDPDHPWELFDNFYFFGGYDCSPGCNFAWAPWGSYYLGLYGPGDGDGCRVDLNDDGVLDFFDVQAWLAAFSAHDPDVGDWNGDGAFDFFDAQSFLGDFSASCP